MADRPEHDSKQPTVYVIAGPNGAGKTTFATRFLPHYVHCREFLNADLIAAGLSPFAPETQDIRAGRLMLERIDELIRQRASFGFETTLSGRGYVRLLSRLKTNGYRRSLFFLWLPTPELAIERVAHRVAKGGHDIPADVVRRRQQLGLANLFRLYAPAFDEWQLYDGQQLPHQLIAHRQEETLQVYDEAAFQELTKQAEAANEEGVGTNPR